MNMIFLEMTDQNFTIMYYMPTRFEFHVVKVLSFMHGITRNRRWLIISFVAKT